MKKTMAIALLGLALLLGGCIQSAPPSQLPEEPVFDNGAVNGYEQSASPVEESGFKPPDDRTWISPGKVMVANFHPGAVAEYPLTVHNGNEEATEFAVYYKIPNHVAEGYVTATIVEQDWVIVADPTPMLMPRETRDIMITVSMPDKATAPAQKWEFWIGVTEQGQGMVRTELCCRWLIAMRD